jgi:tetratricopeptide (TPR) repeat protein
MPRLSGFDCGIGNRMPSKQKSRQHKRKWSRFNQWLFPIAALVLLSCAAYANSIGVPFAFDDIDSIQRNSNVRFGDYSNFSLGLYLQTRSLLYATFAFNNWVGSQNVAGYHIVNLFLHVLNGLLVFAAAVKVFRKAAIDPRIVGTYSLLATAFFLVHPIQTESVTYISSRSELLSTFFYMLGFLFFVILPENKVGFLASLGVTIFLAAGFGAKETVITLPASILLYDYLFQARGKATALLARWRFYFGFVILAAASSYYLLARQVLSLSALETTGENLPRWNYLLTQQRVIFRYIRLVVLPSGLNLDYDWRPSLSLLDPAVLLPFSLILGLLLAAFRWRRTKPIFTFSIFWFFITLSPTSSIIPIPDVIFEHRVYLPLAGVCLSFPLVMEWLIKIWKGGIRTKFVISSSSAVVAVLLISTILRNEVWRDEVRLWSDVLAKSPHKLRPYNQLIYAHMKRGQDEQAITIAKLGSENVPAARVSFSDTIGNLYLRLGRPQEAVTHYKEGSEDAVRLGMGSAYLAGAFNNLAVAYMALAKTFEGKRGQISDDEIAARRADALRSAREWLGRSLDENPNNVGVLDSFVNVTRSLGEARVLEGDLRKKLEVNPNDFKSLYWLAALLSLEERYSDSLDYFQRAEQIRPISEVLSFNYAFALAKKGEIDRAIDKYLQALRADPLFNEAHYNLALLYTGKRDYDNALSHLGDILSRNPADVRANMRLAEIYVYLEKLPLARQHLRQVLQAAPQDPQALSLFQKIGTQP